MTTESFDALEKCTCSSDAEIGLCQKPCDRDSKKPEYVGTLGQDPEAFERDRIAGLPKSAPPATLGPLEERDKENRLVVRGEVREMAAAVVNELVMPLRQQIVALSEDVRAASGLMHMMDVPMEAIASAHERASASFETLRRDILGGGMDKLEQVLDVSGLSEQASKTEQRLQALVERLEKKVDEALTENAKAMVQVLKLLERMHSRELHKANRRKLKKVPA